MTLLCGRMQEPSTAARGVALWMVSLAESRASRIHLPDKSAARSTSATCGQTPVASSSSPESGSCSSKTSPACSRRGLTKSLAQSGFGETYKDWVLRLRADCSQRRKLARRTSANGSSSSQSMTAWPTPAARDGKGANGKEHLQAGTGRKHLNQLPNFVAHLWSTPTAHDGRRPGPDLHSTQGNNLSRDAALWYTPNVPNGGRTLAQDTSPTGMTADGTKRQVGLENQARLWPTPTSLSYGDSHQPGNSRSMNETLRLASFLPAQTTSPHGLQSPNTILTAYLRYRATTDSVLRSERRALLLMAIRAAGKGWTRKAPTDFVRPSFKRSLNPIFVADLMGWPQPAPSGCGFSATALCRWRQLMRSALWRLDLQQEAQAVQVDLFA